jgi:hypothetical protein
MSKIEQLVQAEMNEYYDGAYIDSACAKDQLRTLIRKVVIECAGRTEGQSEAEDILNHFDITYDEAVKVWSKQ